MINKFVNRAVIVLMLCGVVQAADAGPRTQKPALPIKVDIVPVEQGLKPADIKPGDVVDLHIEVRSMTSAQDIQVQIELGRGTDLVSGGLSWRGSISQAEVKVLSISVRAPAEGIGRVIARVSLNRPGSMPLTAEKQYLLGGKKKTDAVKSGTAAPRDAKGREIEEYRQ